MSEQQQPPGQALIQVSFSGPLPSELADITSLLEDFTFAKDCAAAYLNLKNLSIDDPSRKVVGQALWTAAVIAYRRGFTKGKAQLVPQASRLKIPGDFYDQLKPEYRQAHDEILAIGNQQMAHYTGAQDNRSVVALLMPPPQPRAVFGTAVMNIGLGTPLDERVRQLGSLCLNLIDNLAKRLGKLNADFDAFVRTQNLDDLYDDPTRINQQIAKDP